MKYLILILTLALTACGGASTTDTNPFQEALGKPVNDQSVPVPTDPFAPVLKKNGG